jgi:hypothetical protein
MYYRKRLLLGLTVLVGCVGFNCGVFTNWAQHRGAVIETWRGENNTFRIRVTSYMEKGSLVTGAYYVFESAKLSSNDWGEIVTFRHDDRPKIPANQVRFLSDQTGYLYMGWVYAVTTDSGTTWWVWDAKKDLPNWQCCNYDLIRNVTIANDGSGMMRLNPIQDRRGEVSELRTSDYGKHWRGE